MLCFILTFLSKQPIMHCSKRDLSFVAFPIFYKIAQIPLNFRSVT